MRIIGDKNQTSEHVFDFMISYLPFPQKSIHSELAKLFSISICCLFLVICIFFFSRIVFIQNLNPGQVLNNCSAVEFKGQSQRSDISINAYYTDMCDRVFPNVMLLNCIIAFICNNDIMSDLTVS